MIGIDLVHIPSFSEQLNQPGTTFIANFTDFELSNARNSADYAQSLAGKWAAKEAFIKAWDLAHIGEIPLFKRDTIKLQEIEVISDLYKRPQIRLSDAVQTTFTTDLPNACITVSISHDGDNAVAVCQIVSEV